MSTASMAAQASQTTYEMVIGLEVHIQLKTTTKLFSDALTTFGADPNEQTTPICLGMPGVLPVVNEKAVELAILTGLALNCHIAEVTKFDRKHYFYPDLPKGYQISQYDMPICYDGHIDVLGRRIGIERAHLEEDAGKLVHGGADGLAGSTYSLVDLNRAGMPLLEIVSRPDIRSSEEARVYGETLRNLVRYIDVCDGNLEEGSMRVDVNISVRPTGETKLGTKTELKNMNSFRYIQKAIEYEAQRQIALVESGQAIVQESRLWNEAKGITESMRSKEDAHDYRYFPDPDLRPLTISRQQVDEIGARMPELPHQRLARFKDTFGLSDYDATQLVDAKELGDFFDRTAQHTKNYKAIANWLMGDITNVLKTQQQSLGTTTLTPENLASMIELTDQGTISSAIAKKLLPDLMAGDKTPQQLVDEKGLAQISDTGAIEAMCKEVLEANPDNIAQYKAGKTKVLGFLVGQVMKASKGKANPQMINDILIRIIENS